MREQSQIHYCNLPEMPRRAFAMAMNPSRMEAIIMLEKKWVNGTKLKYFLFNDDSFFTTAIDSGGNQVKIPWKGSSGEKEVVRNAFKKWKNQGIGLEFEETTDRLEAHVRIGFAKGEGSWSYVGRDSWDIPKEQRTMNFGWDILDDQDTVLHEIGHAMGFPHEHQNPNAGIVWNEEAVYTALAAPPNSWSREKTFHNIIRKIEPDAVQGSSWDPNSIMHYPFGPGLITAPSEYANGLFPEDGLSARDIAWVQQFYPKMDKRTFLELKPFHSEIISLDVGGQINLEFKPEETRTYTISTFGTMDTVMILSEEINGENVYLSGDDDSGEDRNSYIKLKLIKGKKYIVNIRLYYKESTGDTCVMLW
ncbi:M12 family metallopeptidase [Kriegella aquimaris]|uniref:Astacin (Peptidase family M12A) n=1 Tax=Kriegella aquimaris TaxID=192904 RepID=A0A1G9N892_9FLAO|nr:M12 family metallopeptidase [Kriegella aquimaris]SDL82729.1 Astacin (Peptidase family M12A) [Kriegella aquimaris]